MYQQYLPRLYTKRTTAGLFILGHMDFDKPGKSIEQQIAQLTERGMFIDNERAADYLSNISYYRLSAYWYTFIEAPVDEHRFKEGTHFAQVIETYVFDRKLRLLLFDEIERIEVALRTQMIHRFCLEFGNNWYENSELFPCREYHHKFMDLIEEEIAKSNEKFIAHYRSKYTNPRNPPCWMTLELASFGQLSSLYKNVKTCAAKKSVAEHFKVDETILSSWLEFIAVLRNRCAHHARTWNKQLPKRPKIPTHPKQKWLTFAPKRENFNRVYVSVAIVLYLLKCIVPTTTFVTRFKNLLKEYPAIPRAYMGFPDNWEEDHFWDV